MPNLIPPPPEDFSSEQAENNFFVRSVASQETLKPQEIETVLAKNFVHGEDCDWTRLERYGYIPRPGLFAGQIVGLPASGKHVVSTAVELALGDSFFRFEEDKKLSQLQLRWFNRQVKPRGENPLEPHNVKYTHNVTDVFLAHLYGKNSRQPEDSTGDTFISTIGPINEFVTSILGSRVYKDKTADTLFTSDVLSNLKENPKVDELQALVRANGLLDIFKNSLVDWYGVENSFNVHSPDVPLIKTPNPHMFLLLPTIEQLYKNELQPIERQRPFSLSQWTDDNLIKMRYVYVCLSCLLPPESVHVLDISEQLDFTQSQANKIVDFVKHAARM